DLGGAPAPLTGDDLVALCVDRPHQDRLHQALLADGRGQLLERGVVHPRARLIPAALEQLGAQRRLVLGNRRAVGIAVEERVESPAESLQLHCATTAESPLRERISPTSST